MDKLVLDEIFSLGKEELNLLGSFATLIQQENMKEKYSFLLVGATVLDKIYQQLPAAEIGEKDDLWLYMQQFYQKIQEPSYQEVILDKDIIKIYRIYASYASNPITLIRLIELVCSCIQTATENHVEIVRSLS